MERATRLIGVGRKVRSHMRPSDAMAQATNPSSGDSEHPGKFSVWQSALMTKAPNFPDLRLRESRVGVSFSSKPQVRVGLKRCPAFRMRPGSVAVSSGYPSLPVAIPNVVLMRAQEQMVRVDAQRLIAVVTDEKRARIYPRAEQIRYPMGFDHFPRQPEGAVSCLQAACTPEPAFTGASHRNFRPKTLSILVAYGRLSRFQNWHCGHPISNIAPVPGEGQSWRTCR